MSAHETNDASPSARLWLAGRGRLGQPVVAELLVAGSELHARVHAYRDPARVAGGPDPGTVTALTPVTDVAGGAWLLATVERGRPRLLALDGFEVVALLGRRREWPGAASSHSAWLDLRCAAPRRWRDALLLTARTRGGPLDLLRVRVGQPLERWRLAGGPSPLGFVHLHASDRALVVVGERRYAPLELDALVPGSYPLTDPRETELTPTWRPLPTAAVGVCDLVERDGEPHLRALAHDRGSWRLVELPCRAPDQARGEPVALAEPRRWLSARPWLWLLDAAGQLVRVGDQGPELGRGRLAEPEAWTASVDAAGHPWLWAWRAHELLRIDGLALADPPRRWRLPAAFEPLRAATITVAPTQLGPAGDARTVQHPDELAELAATDPDQVRAWRSSWTRGSL